MPFPEASPLNIYLGTNALISLTTTYFYLTTPEPSIVKLGGKPSPTSIVLTQLLASGEALVSYMCLEGLFSSSSEARAMIVRGVGVYTLIHMSTFWWGHKKYVKHPKGAIPFICGLGMGAGVGVWWGVLRREGLPAFV
ncbi:hypothetical protein L873DRAFT_1474318 [Choiromyces venosus 120613-1]|uniref:Uncharacterized protein n=1 Tax=Choiromyces venosus 120613-1 TaxID=1336337 RepID=A0A3N4J772_9PEZI|nr:hypothetical protein L873DRAFT_1474318 [Choiromyces venosus 120613-1]